MSPDHRPGSPGRPGLLRAVLPGAVSTAERRDDDPRAEVAAPELPAVRRAGPARHAEFATARACARLALGGLGVAPGALPRRPDGAPAWPPGVVGSLTHCRGFRGAAVARRNETHEQIEGLGIDAEPHRPLPAPVRPRVIVHSRELDATRHPAGPHLDTVVFSAKESVYKAVRPITGRWFGFRDAEVVPGPDGTLDLRLLIPVPPGLRLTGRYLIGDGLVVTAVVVRREARPC